MELITGVRPMIGKDIEEVARLERVCFSEYWSENLIRSGLDSRLDTYFVYQDHDRILGYSIIRVLADEGEIQRIAVYPSWMPWFHFPKPEAYGPLPWRYGRAMREPESFMNPTVSGRRPCARGTTTALRRMRSSCGIGKFETIST